MTPPPARVWSEVGYHSAHERTTAIRGRARELPCVWCGVIGPTNAWSFDYRAGERTRVCPKRGALYSVSPWDYSVRCASPCHRVWDLINTTGRAPLWEAAGWLELRLTALGGSAPSALLNAEAEARGIPRTLLSEARRRCTPIESVPAFGRAQTARVWRLPERFEMETDEAV